MFYYLFTFKLPENLSIFSTNYVIFHEFCNLRSIICKIATSKKISVSPVEDRLKLVVSLIQLERRKVAIEKRWRLAEVWLRHVIEPRFDCRDAVHLLEQNLLKQVNVGRSKDHSNWNVQQKHSFHAFVKREGQNKKIVFLRNFYTCGHWPFKPLDPHTNSPNWSPYISFWNSWGNLVY